MRVIENCPPPPPERNFTLEVTESELSEILTTLIAYGDWDRAGDMILGIRLALG